MALRYGTKKRTQAWAECRNDERLKKGNVAVIQGDTYEHPTRGTRIDCYGVCSIDFDGNAEKGISGETIAKRFFELNPQFKWSFRTGGARGFNVWFRITGKCPRSFILKDEEGNPFGEFRATGNYTVAQGKHPSGVHYRTIVDLPAITITDFSTVKWVDGEPLCKKGTQEYSKTYKRREELGGRLHLVAPLVCENLPSAPHQTDKLHWNLIGEILGAGYQLTLPERLDIGRSWFDLSDKNYLREEIDRDGYAKEFANRFQKRKYAKGGGSEAFENALDRAHQFDPPSVAVKCFPHSSRIQLIASLCRELARDSANNRFFLSVRKICEVIQSGTPKLGSQVLKDLETIGLIACVNRPQKGVRKAKEYLYLGNDFDLEVIA